MDKCGNVNCGVCYPRMGCYRELRPGAQRLRHTLLDHVDYSEGPGADSADAAEILSQGADLDSGRIGYRNRSEEGNTGRGGTAAEDTGEVGSGEGRTEG